MRKNSQRTKYRFTEKLQTHLKKISSRHLQGDMLKEEKKQI